ncbi:hypothetical protein LCGC14_2865330 [marine sediment metagenome]|uniref:Uncharacterized protein n=1 Tax=marine sediment metagenome TaxID=412755 RepID=A0A0F8Y4C2_9ZZZZ
MAIARFGVPVIGARGTIGGLIFSANKAGPYIRIWSKGSNPRTAAQSKQRGILTSFASNWRNLTQVQRDDWDDYADDPAQELTNSLGVDYFISGFNWYGRINTHLELAGEADRVDAPTLVRPVAPILGVAIQLWTTGAAQNTRVIMTAGSPDLTENHVVFSHIVGQGRNVWTSRFSLMTIAVPDAGRRVFFQTEIESAFGTIILGQRMFVEVSIQDAHGQRGPVATAFADAQSV